jgi:prevent-host-death family protein
LEADVRTIKAGEFKAKCLALLDEVAASGETIEITKRGKVVARLGPARDTTELFGRSRHLIQLADPNDDLTDTLSESDIAAWYDGDSDEPELNEVPVKSQAKSSRPASRKRRR